MAQQKRSLREILWDKEPSPPIVKVGAQSFELPIALNHVLGGRGIGKALKKKDLLRGSAHPDYLRCVQLETLSRKLTLYDATPWRS